MKSKISPFPGAVSLRTAARRVSPWNSRIHVPGSFLSIIELGPSRVRSIRQVPKLSGKYQPSGQLHHEISNKYGSTQSTTQLAHPAKRQRVRT